jgi:23S rRNA pseudouridine1911/1915/1917 synthase
MGTNKFNPKNKEKPAGNLHLFKVEENTTLMPFLISKMPEKSRNNIKSLLSYKQVLVDGKVVTQFNCPLIPEQKVEISGTRHVDVKMKLNFEIVYEDESLIVINKPAGLLSIATKDEKRDTAYSFLSEYVKNQNRENKIFIVHRLDRETSGLMLFAKNEKVKHMMQESWNDSIIERTYVALVEGQVEKKEGVISSFLYEDKSFIMHSVSSSSKGQKAITHFKVIKSDKSWSLLEINLETGRKNQIRVHMQDIGHSVAGDKKYGAKTNPIKRLALHALKLSFIHPVSNEKMDFETAIPKSFIKIFK